MTSRAMAGLMAYERYANEHLAAVIRAQEWSLPDPYELPVAQPVEPFTIDRDTRRYLAAFILLCLAACCAAVWLS